MIKKLQLLKWQCEIGVGGLVPLSSPIVWGSEEGKAGIG